MNLSLGKLPGAGAVSTVVKGVRRGLTRLVKPVVEPVVHEAVAEESARNEQEGAGANSNASDAAIRKADELGVDLSSVEGSGAGGMVTARDVLNST